METEQLELIDSASSRRIKNIRITGLFGVFDHEVELCTSDRLTILYGENGVGKTTLLNMLFQLFAGNYKYLASVPFKLFDVTFSDSTSVRIRTLYPRDRDTRQQDVQLEAAYNGKEGQSYIASLDFREAWREGPAPSQLIRRFLSDELSRVSPNRWKVNASSEIIGTYEVLERYSTAFPDSIIGPHLEPKWLRTLRKSVPIRFVTTNRLSQSHRQGSLVHNSDHTQAVEAYSTELSIVLQKALTEYATLSQELDRSFPMRVVEQMRIDSEVTQCGGLTLQERFTELELLRQRLLAVGVLKPQDGPSFRMPSYLDSATQSVLSVYIADMEVKLHFFDALSAKFELLLEIINSRFTNKTLTVNQEEGLVFTTTVGRTLRPNQLSSGEQHELLLIYELLFKTPANSMIMIDGPELSLHVVWQEQFLAEILPIAQRSGFDVLIATHSPQIIFNRWDLTVELRGASLVSYK